MRENFTLLLCRIAARTTMGATTATLIKMEGGRGLMATTEAEAPAVATTGQDPREGMSTRLRYNQY